MTSKVSPDPAMSANVRMMLPDSVGDSSYLPTLTCTSTGRMCPVSLAPYGRRYSPPTVADTSTKSESDAPSAVMYRYWSELLYT